MSALPQRDKWTVEEYLDYEYSTDERHEYLNGDIIAFAGASKRHNQITARLMIDLGGQLLERDCEIFQSDMRVRVAENAYFYPDVVVVCGEDRYAEDAETTLLNPTMVIEVLSRSTKNFDRNPKFMHYRQLPSLMDYLLVYQDEMHMEHYTRKDDTWVLRDFRQPEAVVKLPSIDCTLTLSAVYRKVTFDEQD